MNSNFSRFLIDENYVYCRVNKIEIEFLKTQINVEFSCFSIFFMNKILFQHGGDTKLGVLV